jgi:DNA polymerase-3 subunit epsilon
MILNLTRPVAFFDLETTGVDVASDRIVEISILKILPDGNKLNYTRKVNPGMPIPQIVSEIHGIYDDDIANEPLFKDIAAEVDAFLKDCDLAGYNSNKFDVPVLAEEFLRAGIDFSIKERRLIDVQNIFHKMEQRTLVAAYKFYCQKELVNAHSAEADTLATYEILEAQLQRYNEVENDSDFLHEFSQRVKVADLAGRIAIDKNGVEVFNFGKHKGKSVEELFRKEPSYYSWMMNGNFPLYTKKVLKEIKERIK